MYIRLPRQYTQYIEWPISVGCTTRVKEQV
jgi:hypothetical protein